MAKVILRLTHWLLDYVVVIWIYFGINRLLERTTVSVVL